MKTADDIATAIRQLPPRGADLKTLICALENYAQASKLYADTDDVCCYLGDALGAADSVRAYAGERE